MKNLKPKDKKVKEFVAQEITKFKLLYQDEKNKRDKDNITKETKYKLEKPKADDNWLSSAFYNIVSIFNPHNLSFS